MQRPKFIPVLLLLAFVRSSLAAEGNLAIKGFSTAEAAAANPIRIIGPDKAEAGDEVVLRLTGTPPLDLSKPLIEQLDWLIGEDKLYCYLASPGQALIPLDLRGELVFSAAGATMQPLVRITCGSPGEYRLLVDWNYAQSQLAEHILTVEGDDGPDPPPPPPPPPPPENLFTVILEEIDDRAKGLEGAKLQGHIEQVRSYLKQVSARYRILDDDQPAASGYADLLESSSITARPALVVVDCGTDTAVAVRAFGATAADTIERLKAAGVR